MHWVNLNEEERFYTLKTMLERGGGFASALAHAWMRADGGNSRKLGEAFEDLVRRYGPSSDLYVGPSPESDVKL